MELRSDHNCHAIYNLQYHLILVTKFRHPVISEAVFQTIKDQVIKVAKLQNVIIEEIAYEPDHVHILLSAPPQVCLAKVINSMKSTSSRMVRQKHAAALEKYYWKPFFWNRSYMILSSGGAPIEVIRAYIREQNTPQHAAKKKRTANST